ncbi:MAG TPA: choice-of-anchor tandem repeat NxxGxxAF-containing protein, partial [Candidatus Eisenbacteria bacterium]|nr:choice-of-anchor tandem repeat NxxGxxAF-containing protein [Candidatus Eisenbacteria bacterium]
MRMLCAAIFIATLRAATRAHAALDVVVVGARLGGSSEGGDPAPDGDGTFFGSGIPVINDSGDVAFYASFTTGSGGTAAIRGNAMPGSLAIVVRQGDPAPDLNGNFNPLPDADAPPFNDAGQVVIPATFVNTLGANDRSGIVLGDVSPDQLVLLARSGQMVDNIELSNILNPPPVLNASGQVLFSSLVNGAIFLASGGSNTVVARVNQTAPGGGATFALVTSVPPVINDLGQVAFAPLLSTARYAFMRAEGSTIVQVVHDGDSAPGGGTFDMLLTGVVLNSLALNDVGDLAFEAALKGVMGDGTMGIFRGHDADHLTAIVHRGDFTPDHNGRLLDFDFSGEAVIAFNDNGQAAFRSTLSASSHGTANDYGIFRGDGNELVEIARKGDTAPGGDGTFTDFDPPAINDAGQVVFRATLADSTSTQGLYLFDDQDGLTQVARVGESILGSPNARIQFAPDTSRGRRHTGLNAAGQVAFQFALNDGRVGVAVWSPGASMSTTSTSTVLPTTSTTTTTTTTLPPCDTLRCLIETATQGPSCADETVPANIAKRLDVAIARAE